MIKYLVCIALFGLFLSIMFFFRNGKFFVSRTIPKKISDFKNTDKVLSFKAEKEIYLIKKGADYFLIKENFSVEKWYSYKLMTGLVVAMISFMMAMFFGAPAVAGIPIIVGGFIVGFFFLDMLLYSMNKSSNEKILSDVMEMSRAVLYGNRSGQYVADALISACTVVENERLKIALIRVKIGLESAKSVFAVLDELESHFDSAEISTFCTVIRSLQMTGRANDALDTLKASIARQQEADNARRVKHLESKTQIACLMVFGGVICIMIYLLAAFVMEVVSAF